MTRLLGILILTAGVILPMALAGWLAFRLNRKPPLASRRVGLILALNGVLPVGLVLLGLGLMSPAFWSRTWVPAATYVALGAAGLIFLLLVLARRWPGGQRQGE